MYRKLLYILCTIQNVKHCESCEIDSSQQQSVFFGKIDSLARLELTVTDRLGGLHQFLGGLHQF